MTSNSLHTIDLFAGCGGLSLGLQEAGFETLLYSEINDDAANTFSANLGENIPRYGDIDELLKVEEVKRLLALWERAGKRVDLLTGGPPCQGYSAIGHRRTHRVERIHVPSNHLFLRMIEAIKLFKPRMFLFENVKGLVTGSWETRGEPGEIWKDVRAEFRKLTDYEIGWRVVRASDYGVPQNRPRILLVGALRKLDLDLWGDNCADARENSRGLIPEGNTPWPSPFEVLSDLVDPDYLSKPATERYLQSADSDFQREMRTDRSNRRIRKGETLREQEYTRHSPEVRRKFELMIEAARTETELILPTGMKTNKFAQRVLREQWPTDDGRPNITVTSLPDDFIHYEQPRILTVREWARLQTFPDWFVFTGPRTTGGHRRAGQPTRGIWHREVPKYTQIGNAVPVRLATEIGKYLASLLNGGTVQNATRLERVG